MKILRKLYQHTLLVTNEDRVFAGAPIPIGGRFLAASGEVHYVSTGLRNINSAHIHVARGAVVQVMEPGDATIDEDELWDQKMPKDVGISVAPGTQDLDTDFGSGDEDVVSFSEPGLVSEAILLERYQTHQVIWDYDEILSFAKTSDGFVDATPDTYIPNTVYQPSTAQQVAANEVNAYALFAYGNTNMGATTTTVRDTLEDVEWKMLQHLERLLDEAWMVLAGLDEAGAESPGLDIAQLIVELVEPTVVEETAGAWSTESSNMWSNMTLATYVPRNDITFPVLHGGS